MRRKNGTALVKNEVRILEMMSNETRPVHGYRVHREFGTGTAMSTVYRVLYRLRDRGLLNAEWVHPGGDELVRPVQQFTITRAGREELASLQEAA